MKYFLKQLFMLFLFLLISLFLYNTPESSFSADKPELSAGAAKVNITPKEKIPIGWHSTKNIDYEKIHDEVFSRAIVFRDGVNSAAIISVDICGFSNSSWEELTSRIEREIGIKQEYIMLM